MVQRLAPIGAVAEGLSAESGPAERPRAALEEALRTTAKAGLVLGYLITFASVVANDARPNWGLYLSPLVLVAGAGAALGLRAPYRTRAVTLTAAVFGSCLLANLTVGASPAQFLYPCACVLAAVLLGPWEALLGAVLATVALLAAGPLAPRWGTLPWELAPVWLSLAVMWVSVGSIYRTAERAAAGETRAWQHVHEARTRRGDLARTQKALNDMYNLLQRTNYELAVARREAEEAQHLKAQFAANISHELRTPLNLILGFSEMIYHSPQVYGNVRWTPALSADVREIYQATRHLLGMIDDILDLSRVEAQRLPLKLEPTDLRELIRDVTATAGALLREKPVILELKLQPLPEVPVDRVRIRQVLLNLLNNAVRFTDSGRITVTAEERDGEVFVAVTDTGTGIAAEEVATVFEEFGQTKSSAAEGRGGAGLGLAICRQFVRLHGGQIGVESRVGRGSTFHFSIPLPESGRVRSRLSYYAPEGWSPPTPANPLGKTAIVVGPDQEAIRSLSRAIEGYRTIPVAGVEGLAERVEREHPSGVVLVCDSLSRDFVEPADIWDAVGRTDLPVIRCEVSGAVAACQELGVAGYLVKPIQRQQLLDALGRACPSPVKIMVVDDDPGFVAFVTRVLEADLQGIQIYGAYSGEEALGALAGETFDAIILDLAMPGIDGFRLIEAVHRSACPASTAILVCTGSSYEEEVSKSRLGRVEVCRCGRYGNSEIGRYISAVLDVAPPDYSAPAPPAGRPESAAGTRAS